MAMQANILKCVKEGVSLGGLKPKDLAKAIQNHAAIRIQAAFRCHAR